MVHDHLFCLPAGAESQKAGGEDPTASCKAVPLQRCELWLGPKVLPWAPAANEAR